jgi:hypothetical protein
VCVRSVAERSVAKGGEAYVEGGGQCSHGGERFFDYASKQTPPRWALLLRLRRAYIEDRVVTKCWRREKAEGNAALFYVTRPYYAADNLPKVGREGTSVRPVSGAVPLVSSSRGPSVRQRAGLS